MFFVERVVTVRDNSVYLVHIYNIQLVLLIVPSYKQVVDSVTVVVLNANPSARLTFQAMRFNDKYMFMRIFVGLFFIFFFFLSCYLVMVCFMLFIFHIVCIVIFIPALITKKGKTSAVEGSDACYERDRNFRLQCFVNDLVTRLNEKPSEMAFFP